MFNKFYTSLREGKEAGDHKKELNNCWGNNINCQRDLDLCLKIIEIKEDGEKSAIGEKQNKTKQVEQSEQR